LRDAARKKRRKKKPEGLGELQHGRVAWLKLGAVTLDPVIAAPDRTDLPKTQIAPATTQRASGPQQRPLRTVNAVLALLVSTAVLYVSFVGAGPLPALGPAFNPTTGAWTMAADATAVQSQTLTIPGLQQPVRVTFESDGTAHVVAQTDPDLFLAVGYVHARFRLFQMDLMRRQGEGRLSQVVGKAALDSDRFELQLGLLRTAQLEWAQADQLTKVALTAYARGVNDRIDEVKSTHQLPVMFTLLGYEPASWTPIDTLIVKGDMTQTLNFTDTPLVMELLYQSLGSGLTDAWFPILPPNPQSPYDLGPYPGQGTQAPITVTRSITSSEAATALALHDRLAALPPGLLATGGASNNWAVAGAKSASGGALMAGDPHLHLTLPSIWFQLTEDSPDYHTSGVSIPGTPVVLIGHNQHISWSLTDAQNQQTFFYEEKEDAAHPGQYFWNNAWHAYDKVSYDIPIAGGTTDHLTVRLSTHGPVISQRGLTMSVWWAGNLPSQDFEVLMRVGQASNYQEFRDALREWHSPTHNFVYADDAGNIGLISAGYYPLVTQGQPWLPMAGTGEYDVTGTVPYDDIPQIYDPPSNIVWSANQRQVGPTYPYYIGTASNFFDPGYRANEIKRVLSMDGKLSAADMMALQTDTRDYLASEIAPILVEALGSDQLTATEQQARDLLAGWDFRMETSSAAASLWSTFWDAYLSQTFDPWWNANDVPVDRHELDDGLGQDLEAWTLAGVPPPCESSCPAVPACLNIQCALSGEKAALDAAMRQAFHAAFSTLKTRLGGQPASWTWGKLHTRELENLAQVSGLNYGPLPDRGDGNTPLAAGGSPSTHGPSWRMVVDWGTKTFSGSYPGGQSEDPASAWYENKVATWWSGQYAPMLSADEASRATGVATWTMRP
jgi:penicillin amidase